MQQKAWRLGMLGIASAMVAFTGWVLAAERQPAEAIYADHAASYWIGQLGSDQAAEAMRALDTNAIPALVRALTPPPGGIRGIYRATRLKLPPAMQRFLPSPGAWPEFPDETKILIVQELNKMNAKSPPVQLALASVADNTNSSAQLRGAAMEALRRFRRSTEAMPK